MRRWRFLLAVGLLGGFSALGLGAMAQAPAASSAAANAAADDEWIDFGLARELLQKRRRGEKLTLDEEAYLQKAIEARRGRAPAANQPAGRIGRSPSGGRQTVWDLSPCPR